jgi:hypothetical protein
MQAVMVITEGMDQAEILQTSKVDRFGRTIEQSQPFFGNSSPEVQTVEFDDYDRPTRSDLPFDTYPDASNQSEVAEGIIGTGTSRKRLSVLLHH